jgi:hypothetical protein
MARTVKSAQRRGSRKRSSAAPKIAKKSKQPTTTATLEEKPRYQPTPLEKEAWKRVAARSPSLVRVKVEQRSDGSNVIDLAHEDPATGRILLMDALGIADMHFVHDYLGGVVNVASPGKVDDKAINSMLGAIAGLKPRDEAEAMLCAQMVATHGLAMTFARRLWNIDTIQQQDSAVNGITKLTRTYVAQMAALKHYRTGGEQRVIVQRVDVREGGKAVVGVVNSGKGGEASAKNGGQPDAKQIADARSAAVLCDVQAERQAVPVAGGAEPPDLSDARRE